MKKKAIFLDKDGTLIPDIPYNADPRLVSISANAIIGLKQLAAAGFIFVVITNQSGIARGFFSEKHLQPVFTTIEYLLQQHGVFIEKFYHCPHHPDGSVPPYNVECVCRKPHPGMLLRAARELDIDLSESWMIGDILNDIEAGKRAGCHTVLIDNGNETEWQLSPWRTPDFVAKSINAAADFILNPQGHEQHEARVAEL